MLSPTTYPTALLLLLASMLCWGSWANAQKMVPGWRFELFYWDYMWGILTSALLFGLTFGRTDPAHVDSFFHNLGAASGRALMSAFLGGVVFNLGNLLLVAAISIAGLAVAFPVGAGLAVVIGTLLNYVVAPAGNPVLLALGILLIVAAIVADALAYGRLPGAGSGSRKGIAVSLLAGVVIGLFYPFVATALRGPGHLGPYTVYFVFALGAFVSTFPFNSFLMRRPVLGAPVSVADYLAGPPRAHWWGVAGGLVWGAGTICNFVASYVPAVGPAASFALGAGNTMVSALWGVVFWKEFRGADRGTARLLAIMFALFVLGLTAIALAPVVGSGQAAVGGRHSIERSLAGTAHVPSRQVTG